MRLSIENEAARSGSTRLRMAAGVLAVVLALGGCRSTPEVRHYILVAPESPRELGERTALMLGVDYLTTGAAYDDVRMVFRPTPHRLDYYHYHRWSAPPGVLVTDALREGLQESNAFGSVFSGYSARADLLLKGRVVALEEVDRAKDDWVARVVLDLQLEDVGTGRVIWSQVLREEEELSEQTPEALAVALSTALGRVVQTITPQLVQAKRELDASIPSAPSLGSPPESPATQEAEPSAPAGL